LNKFGKEVIRDVEITGQAALLEVARHANFIAEKLVPVDIGRLRAAMYEEVRGKSVYAITGPEAPQAQPEVGNYVKYQYYGALRHRGDVNSRLLSLRALHTDSMTGTGVYQRKLKSGKVVTYSRTFGNRNTGTGEKNLYNRAYKLAILAGEIVKQEPPQWYDRLNERAEFHRDAAEIVAGYFE